MDKHTVKLLSLLIVELGAIAVALTVDMPRAVGLGVALAVYLVCSATILRAIYRREEQYAT